MSLIGWSKKLKFTIDGSKIDGDLTDFPVLITLTSGTGQTSFDATDVFDELTTVSGSYVNRKRIAITTTVSGVETQLYVEIERWDDTTVSGNKKAYLWTKVPTIVSGTDKDLFFYYDTNHTINSSYVGDTGEAAAQNVWDDNFVSVYHLTQNPNNDAANAIKESTSYGSDGTTGGTMNSDDLVDAKIGKGLDFEGTNDYINCGTGTHFDISNVITIETILKLDSAADYGRLISKQYSTTSEDSSDSCYQLGVYGGGSNKLRFVIGSVFDRYTSGNALNDGVYHHVVGMYDRSDAIMYVDSQEIWSSTSYSSAIRTQNGTPLTIGASYANNSDWFVDGVIDEVRVSNIKRTLSWIKASYYSNWNNLITFFDQPVLFYFSNPTPVPASTVYGTSQILKLTVTVSGEDPSYVYDASFFDASDDSQVGSTISGTSSGNYVSTVMSTPNGAGYSWYLIANSSGTQDTSSTHNFSNRFLCQGTVGVNGVLTSGIEVRLYKRDTGELLGNDISTGISGIFEIITDYNEDHYCVALSNDIDTNALIYDYLKPGE